MSVQPISQPAVHQHEWTLLYSHFGWYRDKNSHYHQCFDETCDAMLVGDGRECSCDRRDHRVEPLKADVPAGRASA